MTTRVMLDHATLASSVKVLDGADRASDLDFAAFTTLVESVVLHDEVVVPKIPNVRTPEFQERFEGIVSFVALPAGALDHIERAGVDWVQAYSSAANALELAGLRFRGLYVGSNDLALAVEFGLSEAQFRALRDRARHESSVAQLTANHLRENARETDELAINAQLNALTHQWLSAIAWETLDDQLTPSDHHGRSLYRTIMEMDAEPPARISLPVVEYLAQIYWTLFRTRGYELASRALVVDYAPHPVRSIATAVSRVDSNFGQEPATPKSIASALRQVHDEGREYVNQKLNISIAPLAIAPLFPYVVSKLKSHETVLECALKVKDSKQVAALRILARDAVSAIRGGDLAGARRYAAQLDAIEKFLRSEVGISKSQSSATLSVFGLSVPVPQKVASAASAIAAGVAPGTLLFLRDVFLELQRAASLGTARDRLVARASKSKSR